MRMAHVLRHPDRGLLRAMPPTSLMKQFGFQGMVSCMCYIIEGQGRLSRPIKQKLHLFAITVNPGVPSSGKRSFRKVLLGICSSHPLVVWQIVKAFINIIGAQRRRRKKRMATSRQALKDQMNPKLGFDTRYNRVVPMIWYSIVWYSIV